MGARLPIALASMLIVAGCGAAPIASSASSAVGTQQVAESASESASASASASASGQPTAFTSALYGYTWTVPSGWRASQARGSWDPGQFPFPGNPGIDSFRGPAGERALAARRPLGSAEDLESATDDLAEWLTQTFPICGEPLDREELSVVGEPARLLRFYCRDGFDVFDVVTVRAGAVYVMAYIAPDGDVDAARAALDALLASLSFEE